MGKSNAIILSLLEAMDQKELLTVISIANGLIKTKQMSKEQNKIDVGGIIKLLIATFGPALIEELLHKHKDTPVQSTNLTVSCPTGSHWDATAKACVPDAPGSTNPPAP